MDKMIDLESRIAFQEDVIEVLGKRVAQQEQDLQAMQLQIKHLHQKMKLMIEEAAAQGGIADDGPPPHY